MLTRTRTMFGFEVTVLWNPIKLEFKDQPTLIITYDPEKLERQGFKDISMDIQDREKIKVSAET